MFQGEGLYVNAQLWSNGDISIEGQQLRGENEYEYFLTVEYESVSLLKDSLAGEPADDVLDLLVEQGESLVRAGEMHWLEQHGIPYEFYSWP